MGTTNTPPIERKHLTLRTRIKRLARKTIGFSQAVFMHDPVIGLFVNRYEFGTPSELTRSTIGEHDRRIHHWHEELELPTHWRGTHPRAPPGISHAGGVGEARLKTLSLRHSPP